MGEQPFLIGFQDAMGGAQVIFANVPIEDSAISTIKPIVLFGMDKAADSSVGVLRVRVVLQVEKPCKRTILKIRHQALFAWTLPRCAKVLEDLHVALIRETAKGQGAFAKSLKGVLSRARIVVNAATGAAGVGRVRMTKGGAGHLQVF